MLPTAKEFFFNYVEKNATPYHSSFTNLAYSNDLLTNSIIEDVEKDNQHWVTGFFDELFVGKLGTNEVFASSLPTGKNYTGYLSVYDVGITLACYFWCECFTHYIVNFSQLVRQRRDSDLYLKEPGIKQFLDDVADVFNNWRLSGHVNMHEAQNLYSKHEVKADSPTVANVAACLDKFIVAHEVAHHLAGDTGGAHANIELVKSMMNVHRKIPLHFGSETIEHAADILALYLVSGGVKDQQLLSSIRRHEILVNLTLGSLGALSCVAALIEEPYKKEEEDYPSATSRFNNTLSWVTLQTTLSTLDKNSNERERDIARTAKSMSKDIMHFHDLLNRSRNERGLTKFNPKTWHE